MLMEAVFLDNLDNINLKKIKRFNNKKLIDLAKNIRGFLINVISKTGGHIGANLGTIEISIALHKVFNSPKDKLIFDTGHQAYTHKILTGRANKLKKLNIYNSGISRFTDRTESAHDIIDVSHAATSIPIACGFAKSFYENKINNHAIAIIGDGSLVEGMSFEGLNFGTSENIPLLIVLIDNGYAIDKNIGGIKKMTTGINWHSKSKSFFNSLGYIYNFVHDGHNIVSLVKVLKRIKRIKKPQVFHIKTIKGKGLEIANRHPYKMHFSMPFNILTGEGANPTLAGKSYATEAAKTINECLKLNNNLFVLTPATPYSNNLQNLLLKFKNRVLDVGMAEQHAAGMAAGLCLDNRQVLLCYQSTFMQRAFDQIYHDICYMNLPVTILASRSGFAGYDSPTHHSLMDLSYLRSIPNLQIYYPSDTKDLKSILRRRLLSFNKEPLLILHPYEPVDSNEIILKRSKLPILYKNGQSGTIFIIGNFIKRIKKVIDLLNREDLTFNVVVIKQIKPIHKKKIVFYLKKNKNIIVIEENNLQAGLGSIISEISSDFNLKNKILRIGIEDTFISAGNSEECSKEAGLDPISISKKIIKFLS
jgi:1-deoxy-D-xylulose-5-phosphate synthase